MCWIHLKTTQLIVSFTKTTMITLYAFDTQKCVAHKTHFPCNQTTLFVMYVSDSLKINHFESFDQSFVTD